MPAARRSDPSKRRPPGTTPERREDQLVNLAVDLAERQLRDGTASAQVISHYLKQSTIREKLEQERIRNENLLLEAKIEGMKSAVRVEELYGKAIDAMRSYAGFESTNSDEDFDD